MKIPRPKLNVIELTLLGALIAALGYLGGQFRTVARLAPFLTHSAGELQPFQDRYGPARNSEHGEEWIIRDFFQDQRGGVFVDVGANDPQRFSNTFYLETALGWSGLAVEPQTKFSEAYRTLRPRTTLVPLFVSDVSNREAVLHVPRNNDLIASSSKTFVEEEGGTDIQPVHTNTTTLDDLLNEAASAGSTSCRLTSSCTSPRRWRDSLSTATSPAWSRSRATSKFGSRSWITLRRTTISCWKVSAGGCRERVVRSAFVRGCAEALTVVEANRVGHPHRMPLPLRISIAPPQLRGGECGTMSIAVGEVTIDSTGSLGQGSSTYSESCGVYNWMAVASSD